MTPDHIIMDKGQNGDQFVAGFAFNQQIGAISAQHNKNILNDQQGISTEKGIEYPVKRRKQGKRKCRMNLKIIGQGRLKNRVAVYPEMCKIPERLVVESIIQVVESILLYST